MRIQAGGSTTVIAVLAALLGLAGILAGVAGARTVGLEQECKQALLVPPTILNEPGSHRTELFNPGKLHQFVVVAIQTEAAPSACVGYRRGGRATVKLASARHHHKLVPLGAFPYGNQAEETGGVLSQSDHTTTDNYQCTPGPGRTPVWMVFRSVVKNSNGKIIGKGQAKRRIEVEGGGC